MKPYGRAPFSRLDDDWNATTIQRGRRCIGSLRKAVEGEALEAVGFLASRKVESESVSVVEVQVYEAPRQLQGRLLPRLKRLDAKVRGYRKDESDHVLENNRNPLRLPTRMMI
jgi:hypothetical protein